MAPCGDIVTDGRLTLEAVEGHLGSITEADAYLFDDVHVVASAGRAGGGRVRLGLGGVAARPRMAWPSVPHRPPHESTCARSSLVANRSGSRGSALIRVSAASSSKAARTCS